MEDLVKIKDFYSSVVLRSFDIPLVKLEKNQNRQVTFVFQISKDKGEQLLKNFLIKVSLMLKFQLY